MLFYCYSFGRPLHTHSFQISSSMYPRLLRPPRWGSHPVFFTQCVKIHWRRFVHTRWFAAHLLHLPSRCLGAWHRINHPFLYTCFGLHFFWHPLAASLPQLCNMYHLASVVWGRGVILHRFVIQRVLPRVPEARVPAQNPRDGTAVMH
jgi:hypothetical protein